jgi:hypothetical protein
MGVPSILLLHPSANLHALPGMAFFNTSMLYEMWFFSHRLGVMPHHAVHQQDAVLYLLNFSHLGVCIPKRQSWHVLLQICLLI